MEDFAEWLRTELKQRGWQNIDLAREAGISDAQVSRVVSGTRGAGPDFCVAIARGLGIDLALAYAGGAMDMMVYQAADQEIVRQVEAWVGERVDLEAALARVVSHEGRLAAVRSVAPLLKVALEQGDARELSTALQLAGIRVWCEEGAIVEIEMI